MVNFSSLADRAGLLALQQVAGCESSFAMGVREPAPPDVTLYVGGLGPDTTDKSLRAAVAKLGRVSYARVKRDEIQQSRGFAFVSVGSELAKTLAHTSIYVDGKFASVKPQTRR